MSGASRLIIALAVAGSSTLLGSPVRGAEDDGSQVLPGDTMGAITGDVDGDGVPELVRVTNPNQSSQVLLEAWAHDGDEWSSIGSSVVARLNDEQSTRVPLDVAADGFGLIAWNDGESERVLIATTGGVADDGRGCCLTISSVAMDDGLLRTFPLSGTFGDAETVSVLDLDDDGVDELLVVDPSREAGNAQVRVLRWNGANGFVSETVDLPIGTHLPNALIGETDGVPGDEVVFGPTEDGRLIRLGAAVDGQLVVDEADGSFAGALASENFGTATAGRMLGATRPGIQLMRWPRGGSMEVAAERAHTALFGLSMLGDGDQAVIIDSSMRWMTDYRAADVFVYDLDLTTVLEVPASASTARLMDLTAPQFPALRSISQSVLPHDGPLPGGLGDGRHAYFSSGNVIILEPDGDLSVHPTNGLVSTRPVGVAGQDRGWIALAADWVGTRNTAALYPNGIQTSITMTPLKSVILDTPLDGVLAPDVRDAVLFYGRDGKQRLVALDGGFTAIIDAPPRSLVAVASGVSIIYQGEVGDEPISVDIAPDREREGNQPFDAAILVISPSGAASSVSWAAEILREPPELTASAQTDAFALRSTIMGRTADGASITVDGHAVQPAAAGGFRFEVDAPIWPRDVVVVARDPLGSETVQRLEVVGFLDYRGLPWVPIVGIATLAFGIMMFVRIPRQRSVVMVADGDGRLEEIDGD